MWKPKSATYDYQKSLNKGSDPFTGDKNHMLP
jgi:hypothetical protein